jgi:hypothetical protein
VAEATWWTGDAWVKGSEPEPFASMQEISDETLSEAGYDSVIFGEEAWPYTIEVHDNADAKHLLVVLDCPHVKWLTTFFVSHSNLAAFYVDKLPSMVSAFAANAGAEATQRLTKAIIAFIRHGHGESTIDEFGAQTLEERRAAIERTRLRRLQRENVA